MKIQCRATLSFWNTVDSTSRYWMSQKPPSLQPPPYMHVSGAQVCFSMWCMCVSLMYTEKWWQRVSMLRYSVHTAEVHVSDRAFPLEKGAVVEGRVFYWTCEHCFFRSLKRAWSCRGNLSLVPRLSGAQTLLTPQKRTFPSLYYIKLELARRVTFTQVIFSY